MILRYDETSYVLKRLLFTSVLVGCGATGSAGPLSSTGGTNTSGNGGASVANGGASVANGGDTNAPGGGQSPTTGGAGGVVATGGVAAPTGGATPTGGTKATGGSTCTSGTQIGSSSTNYFMMAYSQLAPFYVFNNGWSSSTTNLTSSGAKNSITAYETCNPGTIAWKTDYDWSGANNTVKAYPAAILGWQSTKGWRVSSQDMLPLTVSSVASAKCSWSYSVSGGAAQNVAYDIWVHNGTCSKSAIGNDTAPSDEVMIWLYSNGGVQPAGQQSQSGLSISGATWTLWEGNVGSWQVHSFVRQGNSTTVNDLDIKAFLDKLNIGSKCLTSIQAGTEIFQGSGTVNTSSFTCDVQ